MEIRAVCPRCAQRWCGVVDPSCPVCAGRGRISATDGSDPLGRLRAVVMHLTPACWRDDAPTTATAAARVARLVTAGLMANGGGDTGLASTPNDSQRGGIGRRAGALLIERGLRARPPRKVPKPKLTAEQRAEERRRRAEALAESERRHVEYVRGRLDVRVRERVFDLLAHRYPAEIAELREGEEVLVALEDNLPVIGAHRPWR